jgi:Asp-tRNA(Asn)/Glu-tRNA(Gln) amidotransferase A subunit family amidase
MGGSSLWQLAASELLDGYARRQFSPVEVVDELYARIEQLNLALRAYLALNADDARQAARAAEARWRAPGEKPLLCGVPVAVKDTIELQGLPTTYGSLAFRDNYQPDSEIVHRLRRAGAVLLGKTNTPEFALGAHVLNRLGEPGTNPWDLEHTCGGSSGGSAAAVAAGLAAIGLGTDSGGSIRMPAAYNGIFGIKPTYQRIPTVQAWRAAPGRSHNGPLSRTVRDSALLLQALAGPDPRDPSSHLGPPPDFLQFATGTVRGARVAVSHDFGNVPDVESAVRQMVDAAAELLRDLGCELIPADPPALPGPDQLAPGVWAYAGDHYAAAERMVPEFWAKHADDLTDYARPIYEAGRRALAWQYRAILSRNAAYAARMKEWFAAYDFLISPVSGPAPRNADLRPGQRAASAPGFMLPFNTAYNPAAAVPFAIHPSGLPLAIQVVGRLGDDVGVLRLAAAIEAQQPWAHRWPPLATTAADRAAD